MNDETAEPRRRLHAVGRQARRERIFERIRRGLSYDDIALKEGLSVQHVRRIVGQALKEREAHAGAHHAKPQLDRLRLARRGKDAGRGRGPRQPRPAAEASWVARSWASVQTRA